jgi:hypothetical protein
VDVDENIDEAEDCKGNPLWFGTKVRPGGDWDYKKKGSQYENFGNFNFGATGAAVGIPPLTLYRGAGAVQVVTRTSLPEWGKPFGDPPYGDDPWDQLWIMLGIWYYNQQDSE